MDKEEKRKSKQSLEPTLETVLTTNQKIEKFIICEEKNSINERTNCTSLCYT